MGKIHRAMMNEGSALCIFFFFFFIAFDSKTHRRVEFISRV